MTSFSWNVYLNLSGTAWTDVTADVLTTPTIHGDYGIKSAGPTDRVAPPGRCTFSLNNGERNSAGLVGYYSPGNANCRSGFDTGIRVKVTFTYANRTKIKFFGKIAPDGIKIITGTYNSRQVQVTCYDYMEDCNVHEITLPTLMSDTTIDAAVPQLTAMLPRGPVGTSYAAGVGTFPYVFDMTRTGGRVSQEFQRLAMSEIGYIFPRYDYNQDGETLVIQSRNTRGQVVGYEQVGNIAHGTILDSGGSAILDSGTSPLLDNTITDATFSNVQSDMDVTRGDYLYNRVDVITYPRRVVAGTTLWTLDKEFSIAAGGTFLLRFTYVDPTGGTAKCGGVNVVQPVGTTDYTCFSGANGAGSSMTSALSFDYCLTGAYDTNVMLHNNAAVKMYVHTFKERGDAILTYNQSESVQSDATSIATYGTRSINYDMKYEGDPTLPAPYAGVMLARHKDPSTQIKTVKFCANGDDQLMEYFMAIEPGAKVKLTETVSGQDDDYFVNGVSWDISGGKKLDCTYYVKRTDAEVSVYQYSGYPSGDTWLDISNPTTNYGTFPYITSSRMLMKFDLSSIPGTINSIVSAKLYVYCYNYGGGNASIYPIYRVKRNWISNEANYNVYSTGNNWGGAGATGTADIDTAALSDYYALTATGWSEIDLNPSYISEMIGGTTNYYGFKLIGANSLYSSSEYADSTKRPYLVINYLL